MSCWTVTDCMRKGGRVAQRHGGDSDPQDDEKSGDWKTTGPNSSTLGSVAPASASPPREASALCDGRCAVRPAPPRARSTPTATRGGLRRRGEREQKGARSLPARASGFYAAADQLPRNCLPRVRNAARIPLWKARIARRSARDGQPGAARPRSVIPAPIPAPSSRPRPRVGGPDPRSGPARPVRRSGRAVAAAQLPFPSAPTQPPHP